MAVCEKPPIDATAGAYFVAYYTRLHGELDFGEGRMANSILQLGDITQRRSGLRRTRNSHVYSSAAMTS